MKKCDREIMEILEAFDSTGCAHSAAALSGVDAKTVRRYVAARDAGRPLDSAVSRPKLIDEFMGKIEEWVDRSEGKVRADVAHERLSVKEIARLKAQITRLQDDLADSRRINDVQAKGTISLTVFRAFSFSSSPRPGIGARR